MSRDELDDDSQELDDALAAKVVKKGIGAALKAVPVAAIGGGLLLGGGFVLVAVGLRKIERALRRQEVEEDRAEFARESAAFHLEREKELEKLRKLEAAGEGGAAAQESTRTPFVAPRAKADA